MQTINPETGEIITFEKPTQSAEIDKLASALAKAQIAFSPIPKSKTVTVKTNSGASYSYNYAPLDSILTATRKPLSENGLAIVQTTRESDKGTVIDTILMHATGQWISSSKLLGSNADPKQFGGIMTYHRRYQISAILGVSSEDDDDASGASGEDATISAKTKTKPPQPTNGKPSGNVPNTADDLLKLVNQRVTVTYDNVPHMFNAIRQELEDNWTWPEKKDIDGWRKAYKAAVDHARAKEQPAEQPEAGQEELQF